MLILPPSLAKNLHFYLLVNPGAPGGEDLAVAPVLAGTALEEEEEEDSIPAVMWSHLCAENLAATCFWWGVFF